MIARRGAVLVLPARLIAVKAWADDAAAEPANQTADARRSVLVAA